MSEDKTYLEELLELEDAAQGSFAASPKLVEDARSKNKTTLDSVDKQTDATKMDSKNDGN